MATSALPVLTDAEELVALRRQIDELEHQFAKVLARFERSREWAADRAPSVTAWVRWRCGMTGGGAAQRVAVARCLEALAEVDEAFARADMSYAHVAAVARLTEVVGAGAVRRGVDVVIDTARRLAPDQFSLAIRHLRHLLDPDGGLDEANDQYRRRWLRLSQILDGVYVLDGVLDAEAGAAVEAALDRLMVPAGRDDRRNPAQRRADALVELATGAEKAHITLTASGAELTRRPVLAFETLRRLACDSVVTEVDRSRMTVGTRRTVPPSLRRALELRDGGCTWPGCGRPPEWCDGHHVEHWADGGATSLDNLRLLCRYHHRMEHEGRAGP
jgi:Domain of unknown function (DUF222)/HNH endonuclease